MSSVFLRHRFGGGGAVDMRYVGQRVMHSPASALIRDLSKSRDELFPPSYSYSSMSPPVVPEGSHRIRRSGAMSVVIFQWRFVFRLQLMAMV